jgi:hypothetical protein
LQKANVVETAKVKVEKLKVEKIEVIDQEEEEEENIEINDNVNNSEDDEVVGDDYNSLDDDDDGSSIDDDMSGEDDDNDDDDDADDNESDEILEPEIVEKKAVVPKIEKKKVLVPEIVLKPAAKKLKKDLISPNIELKSNYKPRVNTTSKEMVIRQLTLAELSTLDEIPTNDAIQDKADDEDDVKNVPVAKTTNYDPFFLSANGGIQKVDTSNVRTDDSVRDNFDDEGHDWKFKNSKYLNSSFTNLSSSRDYRQPYDNNRGGYDRNDRYSNNNNNNNSSYNGNRDSYKRYDNVPSRNDQNGYKKNDNNYEKPQQYGQERSKPYYEEKVKPKPVEDLSNLHPSWKAKKEQEEKLKSMKFSGTKVQFDD